MSDLQENDTPVQVTKNSPGKRLRKAREGRGLSKKDIAERLHLSERVIDAIERDDRNHLPAHTFVRGYLRGYAPIVALDADSLVADYNDYFTDELGSSEVKDTLKTGIQRNRTGKLWTGKIKAYLALVLCVVVGIGYFSGQESTDDKSNSEQEAALNQASNLADAEAGPAGSNNLQIQDSDLSYQRPENSPEGMQEQQYSENIEQAIVSASVDDGVNADSESNQENYAEKTKASQRLSSSSDIDTLEDGIGVVPSQEPGLKKNSSPVEVGNLSLQFHADSWTEVHDARGERLLYRLGREGRTYRLSGTAPFKVLLGNAKEVTVILNGQLFNQTPFTRGQVARFSVGEELVGEKSTGKEPADTE